MPSPGARYQRRRQPPPHRPPPPPPPPSSLTSRSSNIASTVALTIALSTPVPRWTPSRGNTQLPMKAPTIPTRRSPIIPNPVPRTILPANHPATMPTSNMTRRLSFEICIGHLGILVRHSASLASSRQLATSPHHHSSSIEHRVQTVAQSRLCLHLAKSRSDHRSRQCAGEGANPAFSYGRPWLR